ncbi:MAG: transcription-repair coupling factor, partial [Bacteroidales bacterium]|nr:transcription-repair coupling factor [Bacteroidales bacterium]
YRNHYRQEDFVYEPGQFAWRGGIFDLYAYSEESPIRLELSGNSISSLRRFDSNTQLSIGEQHSFKILPHISGHIKVEERCNFIRFLLGKPCLWLNSIPDLQAVIQDNYAKTAELYLSEENELEKEDPKELFLSGEEFLKTILEYPVCELNSDVMQPCNARFDFDIKPQNNFSKNFELLLDEWIANLERGFHSWFLSENEHQIERVRHIMADLLIQYNRKNQTQYTAEQLFAAKKMELHEGFRDESGKICLYTDHQFFAKYHRFSIRDKIKKSEAFTLKEIYNLQAGDFVVHIDHGIGIYQGLQKMDVNGKEQEVIRLAYKDGDMLYVSIHSLHKISKYAGKEGVAPALHRIGSGSWEKLKERTKRRVKELAIDLIKLYAKRKSQNGFAFGVDNYLQNELEASFMYEDTPDQVKSLCEIKADMESEHPMDRLICGDVGFGKTEIAVRAAFKAVCDNKQVAVLVPTTVLALQHFTTFSERLKDFPSNIDYINRFKSAKQIKECLQKLKTGMVDILIGTHRLLSKDVEFKDLGLLIIDEEQKFGVAAKEKLRELKVSVDTLTLSATPIPRTLQFSLMGARDISVIATPPPNRYPIQTEVHLFNEELIRDAVNYEIARGGQLFFVHNKIQNIAEVAGLVQRLVPEARIAVGHGQMEGAQLEEIMLNFINGRYDVLVATTIVESGLDIGNANTMIINDAQNYALNVLHQLRGRVGRNNKKAFCYMLIRSFEELNEHARKRLKAIEEYSDIGSGFQIAMRDLDIRGAGDILGGDQSGFINDIGFDMYQKILNEAIVELRESGEHGLEMADSLELLQRECLIETDLGLLIPTDYVSSVSERMNLYKELDAIANVQKLEKFRRKLLDLFGPIPPETEELMQTILLRQKAINLHFEKISLRKNSFTGYFAGKSEAPFFQSELFGNILSFMQAHYPQVQIKEQNGKPLLQIEKVNSVAEAIKWLESLGI